MANNNKRNKRRRGKFEKQEDRKKLSEARKMTQERDPKYEEHGESKKHWNDASWYIPDENLRRIVGSISYQGTLGVPIDLSSTLYGDGGVVLESYASSFEPINVMSIEYFAYPGADISVTGSPVNGGPLTTGMRKLFAAISALTGRAQTYTPEDLGFAIMAVGDLVSAIAFAQRIIGIYYTYNPRNRGIPKVLIEAMGIQFDSLNENITRMRDSLNAIITSANNIRMVKDIKYFTKCWELYSHVYKDAESGMAQYYVTKPAGFLTLDETPDPETGQIETKLKFDAFAQGNTPVPYSQLLRKIERMVNALLTSTTLKDVYNDILNYVNKQGGNLLGFSYVPELYSILPEYNETFLNQIHNMSWGHFDLTDYEITGDPLGTNLVTSDIYRHSVTTYEDNWVLSSGDEILDMLFTDNPSYDDTIDACMFKSIVKDYYRDTTEGKVYPRAIAAPDHPVFNVKFYDAIGYQYTLASNAVDNAIVATRFMKMSVFRAAPICYQTAGDLVTVSQRLPVANDLNYYTKLDYAKLKGIFDYAFLGLFDAEVKGVSPF